MDNISPFIFWCQKVMPAVLDDSLSYYECLCKISVKLNETITSQNNLIDAQQTLQKYVDEYFTNLDVQNEINNKLDQMAESGELESIIEQYLQFNTATIFNTVSDMKNSDKLSNGMYVQTLGYYLKNDLGGLFYEITNTETNYSVPLMNGLYANPIVLYRINTKMFGTVGNGVDDDSVYIQKAINYCHTYLFNYVYIPSGTYLINAPINVYSNIVIEGNYSSYPTKQGTILLRNTNVSIFNLTGDPYSQINGNNISNVIIKNMLLRTESDTFINTGKIYMFRTIYNAFENVHFSGNGYALVFDKASYDMRFNNCSFTGNANISTCNAQDDQFNTAEYYSTNNIYFNDCRWESYTTGPLIELNNYSSAIVLNNPKFEGTLADGSALIKCNENNSTIIVNSAMVTMLTGSNCSLIDLQSVIKSRFEIYGVLYVESTTKPFIILNDVSSTHITVNPTLNTNNYNLDYYIENSANIDKYTIVVDGSLATSNYYATKRLFSNPEYLNKPTTLNSISAAEATVPLSNFKIKKASDTEYSSWGIGPNFNNYAENKTQFVLRTPNGNVAARFTELNSYINGIVLPTNSEQPPDANGQIYINTFSDSSIPCLNIQISGSNKRIGWGTSYPTTGTWAAGSIVINTSPSVGSPAGWICTSAGKPGVWHPFSNVIE